MVKDRWFIQSTAKYFWPFPNNFPDGSVSQTIWQHYGWLFFICYYLSCTIMTHYCCLDIFIVVNHIYYCCFTFICCCLCQLETFFIIHITPQQLMLILLELVYSFVNIYVVLFWNSISGRLCEAGLMTSLAAICWQSVGNIKLVLLDV